MNSNPSGPRAARPSVSPWSKPPMAPWSSRMAGPAPERAHSTPPAGVETIAGETPVETSVSRVIGFAGRIIISDPELRNRGSRSFAPQRYGGVECGGAAGGQPGGEGRNQEEY